MVKPRWGRKASDGPVTTICFNIVSVHRMCGPSAFAVIMVNRVTVCRDLSGLSIRAIFGVHYIRKS